MGSELVKPVVPSLFGVGDWFHERLFFHGSGWAEEMVQAVTWTAGSSRWSFTSSPTAHLCVARFLTGRGLVPVHGPGAGDPWLRQVSTYAFPWSGEEPWKSRTFGIDMCKERCPLAAVFCQFEYVLCRTCKYSKQFLWSNLILYLFSSDYDLPYWQGTSRKLFCQQYPGTVRGYGCLPWPLETKSPWIISAPGCSSENCKQGEWR